MKATKIKTFKSGILLFAFALILVSTAFISEIFQAPRLRDVAANLYKNPLRGKSVNNIRYLKLSNRRGEFILQSLTRTPSSYSTEKNVNPAKKTKLHTVAQWSLISPRKVPANRDTLEAIVDSLNSMKIRKIFQYDDINVANFSLDKPLLSITMGDIHGEETTFKLGVINPIDGSAYVAINDENFIYQIDALKFSIESLAISDFVDSRVFSVNLKAISKISIYRGQKTRGRQLLKLTNKKGNWYGSNNNFLSKEKVQDLLTNITSIKSQFILDHKSEKLEKNIARYLSYPLYTIEITSHNGNDTQYVVSHTVNAIPELNIEKKQKIIITASDRDYPYLVNKAYLSYFHTKEKELKAIQFKKLFY